MIRYSRGTAEMHTSTLRNRVKKKSLVAPLIIRDEGNTATPPRTPSSTGGDPTQPDNIITPSNPEQTSSSIITIPSHPLQSMTDLTENEHAILLQKQALIQDFYGCAGFESVKEWYKTEPNAEINPNTYSLPATLIFARHEAGTAVCISRDGWILTCARCIASTQAEFDRIKNKLHWLLFFSGQIVSARCVAFDAACDLALLRIVSASPGPSSDLKPRNGYPDADNSVAGTSTTDDETRPQEQQDEFPAITLAPSEPPLNIPLHCLGHTGPEHFDLIGPKKTCYDIVRLSSGKYRGSANPGDQEPQQDSGNCIGALQHDCWTTSGHSGAPLLDRKTGELVGIHSSWDGEEGGMRRGISLGTIKEFLQRNNINY